MEENKKKTYKPNDFLAPNKFVAILFYVLFIFILGAFILYLMAFIYSAIHPSVPYGEIKASFTLKTADFEGLSIDLLKANAVSQGYSNLLVYILVAAIVGFFTRDELQKDLFKFKDQKKRRLYYWFIPVTAIAFTAINYFLDLFISNYVSLSENQIQIENIFKNGGMAPMLIATIFFAPLVEELVFRKCIFSLCGEKRIVLGYFVSVVSFSLIHMITTSAPIGEWALMTVPYLVSALLLAGIYHLSGFNVYVSLIAHICNNILAIILVFI
jgi:membrane protease YdiL (CAAX protease family)